MSEIVYVVGLEMEVALAEEYLAWLREHVREILALPGFMDAQIYERLQAPPPGRMVYSVHYRLNDLAAYEAYLRDYAPRMRSAGARFADRVQVSRTVWRTLE